MNNLTDNQLIWFRTILWSWINLYSRVTLYEARSSLLPDIEEIFSTLSKIENEQDRRNKMREIKND